MEFASRVQCSYQFGKLLWNLEEVLITSYLTWSKGSPLTRLPSITTTGLDLNHNNCGSSTPTEERDTFDFHWDQLSSADSGLLISSLCSSIKVRMPHDVTGQLPAEDGRPCNDGCTRRVMMPPTTEKHRIPPPNLSPVSAGARHADGTVTQWQML